MNRCKLWRWLFPWSLPTEILWSPLSPHHPLKTRSTPFFALKLFFAARQCTRTSDGCIYGDKSSEFSMKSEIDMNFRIFCFLNPGDVELTSDVEEILLRFIQFGNFASYEFSKIISLNWIANSDGPDPFNANHFFGGSSIDPPISVKWWNRSISLIMGATTKQHKDAFDLKFSMHYSVNLIAFVNINMSFCCL